MRRGEPDEVGVGETGSSLGDVRVPRHLKGEDKTDVPMSRNILRTECYVRSVLMVGNIMGQNAMFPRGAAALLRFPAASRRGALVHLPAPLGETDDDDR